MTEAAREQELINTLKTFNNAVVSIRLYPPNAPQIKNAFERGYKTLKHHFRQHGDFTLGIPALEPELCGNILAAEIIQSISNLIVFRQLAHLQKDRFSIPRGIDRGTFQKILEVFSTKVDQIKQVGGGSALIQRYGLEEYFPEEESITDNALHESRKTAVTPQTVDVIEPYQKEFINVLLGREKRAGIITELQAVLANDDKGAPVLAGAVRAVLEGLLQKKLYVTSKALEQMLENCSKLLGREQLKPLLDKAAIELLDSLELPLAVLLMCQDFQSATGMELKNSLQIQATLGRFGEIIREIRQRISHLRLTQSADSKQLQYLGSAVDRLLATSKGKQYLGQEKAKSIMEAGEKARKARRAEAGVKSLLQGNTEVLQSEEFNVHLPFILQKMEADGLEQEVRALLTILDKSFFDGDAEVKKRVIRSIAQICENLVTVKNWALAKSISNPLLYWVKHSDNGDFIYEKACQVLQALMAHGWKSGDLELGDSVLSIFYQIRSGTVTKSGPVRSLVARSQDKGVDHELLSHLLRESLANPRDEIISRRLILQGPMASRFLVESLIRAGVTEDRIKILDLLTYGEQFLPPILIEKLSEPMPWYGKRNLLKLLSETGSAEHLEKVYQFLQHDDLRVQREAFVCLYKISGKHRKKALLHALTEAGETMKLQIVRALIPFADSEVTNGLSLLLDEHKFYSVEFRDTLLSNVCLAIARCPYPDSEKALLNFLEMKGTRSARKIGDNVWKAAEDALKMVEEGYLGERQLKAKASKLRKSVISQVGAVQKAAPSKKAITGLPEEKRIREMLAKEDLDSAKGLLLELIAKIARMRRFAQAEQLREWLIEIDSLALTDIIRAAEIIEEEKHAAVDKGHLEIWSGLFDVLSTEEFSAFYHGLEHKQYRNEEIVMKRGAKQKMLFFINSGRIKLFYQEKDTEKLIKTLQKGEILGIGTFFNTSVWTVNAAALGQANVSILKFETLQKWRDDYPALESKLQDFCHQFESVSAGLKGPGRDRREYTRHKVSALRLTVSLLDSKGSSTGVSAKGDLFDFSRGGASFFMRISKKDNARLLLGRNLRVRLPVEETHGVPVSFDGEIVAVRAHHAMENEYSVHVVFNSPIDSGNMQQILRLMK